MHCHQVDRWQTQGGWCATKDLDALSCTVRPKAECQSGRQQHRSLFTTIPFVVHNTGAGSIRNRSYNGWEPPPVCLPSVHLPSSHVTRYPRPSPAVFVYWKRSNTGSGNGLGTRLLICSRELKKKEQQS